MATFGPFVQSDTRPFFAAQIKNSVTNAVVDLSGATVTFYFTRKSAQIGGVAKVSAGACTVTDAVNGKVEYRWGATDLDVPGTYDAEFRIVHTDGKPQRVRIEDVVVLKKLG